MDNLGRVTQVEYHAALDRRDKREADLKVEIERLRDALQSVLDMETNRYACASERNKVFADARNVLLTLAGRQKDSDLATASFLCLNTPSPT